MRWVNATVSSLHKDTFKHRAGGEEEVRGVERTPARDESRGWLKERGEWEEYWGRYHVIKSDNAKDERESLGCRGKMAGQQEQVDKVMIMINQQDEHTQLTLPSPLCASSLSCDQPLIYDTIAAAMCLRAAHKSTSSLLNTRAHQGYRLQCTAKKNVHLNKSLKTLFFLQLVRSSATGLMKMSVIPAWFQYLQKKHRFEKKKNFLLGFLKEQKKAATPLE